MANTTTYKGITGNIRLIFTKWGIFIVIYTLIGVLFNTAPPHIPAVAPTGAALHSWVQYIISILFWPLSLWHPTFSISQWPAGSTR